MKDHAISLVNSSSDSSPAQEITGETGKVMRLKTKQNKGNNTLSVPQTETPDF